MNPDSFAETGYFSASAEFPVELKWRIQQSKGPSKVVVVLMAIDGGHWLPPRSVTGLGSLFICNG